MKWQLWKASYRSKSWYFLINNEDGWIYLRGDKGWIQTWSHFDGPLPGCYLIANNYKESKKKRKYYHATL